MLKLEPIHNLELEAYEPTEISTDLAVKNYLLFSVIDDEVCAFLSQRYLIEASNFYTKLEQKYPLKMLDEDSYDRLYNRFLEHLESLRKEGKSIIVCGDVNTAHTPIDLARPKANENTSGFLQIERDWMDKFVSHGYIDTFRYIHGELPDKYSWWSYRANARTNNVGWRIDYFFVSEDLKDKIKDAYILDDVLGSDHCPIGLEIEL
jgi:exodeoxyribonuclease III